MKDRVLQIAASAARYAGSAVAGAAVGAAVVAAPVAVAAAAGPLAGFYAAWIAGVLTVGGLMIVAAKKSAVEWGNWFPFKFRTFLPAMVMSGCVTFSALAAKPAVSTAAAAESFNRVSVVSLAAEHFRSPVAAPARQPS